jgi:hypothetical protein
VVGQADGIGRKRARDQEIAADDLVTVDELRTRLTELDETYSTSECDLKTL